MLIGDRRRASLSRWNKTKSDVTLSPLSLRNPVGPKLRAEGAVRARRDELRRFHRSPPSAGRRSTTKGMA